MRSLRSGQSQPWCSRPLEMFEKDLARNSTRFGIGCLPGLTFRRRCALPHSEEKWRREGFGCAHRRRSGRADGAQADDRAGFGLPFLADYFQRMWRVCDECSILLILDEVMCGMGHTGTIFALEQEGVAPDLVTIAKRTRWEGSRLAR